jgi:hypothetical protein
MWPYYVNPGLTLQIFFQDCILIGPILRSVKLRTLILNTAIVATGVTQGLSLISLNRKHPSTFFQLGGENRTVVQIYSCIAGT